MAGPPTSSAETARGALFDRYLLPKVALTIILAASLLGTWVSTGLVGGAEIGVASELPVIDAVVGDGLGTVGVVLAKWSYVVALGVLAGGLLWKHAFVRPADVGGGRRDDGTPEYCAEMYRRFDRIAAGTVLVTAVGGAATVATYVDALGWSRLVVAHTVILGALLVVTTATVAGQAAVDAQFRSTAGLAALALALGLTATTGAAEVALRGIDVTAVLVRVLHLLAFAVWIGGAVWNIFVAVPTGQRRPTTAVVGAAGEQLERFRWAVRLVIPTILLTGAYQGFAALGWSPTTYVGSWLGLAVLAKLGTIGVLVVIFKLCPMWRACSPIEGVCDLEDLAGGPADQSSCGQNNDSSHRPDAAADGGVAEVADDE